MSTPYRTSVELDMEATIASLAAENRRLSDANRVLAGRLNESLDQRDAARAIAVELEQQLAQIQAEMASLERSYEQLRDEEPTVEHQSALDAVYDCSSSVEVVTDVVGGDVFMDQVREAA